VIERPSCNEVPGVARQTVAFSFMQFTPPGWNFDEIRISWRRWRRARRAGNMGVCVLAEEATVEGHVTALFGRCSWQAGVIIGAVRDTAPRLLHQRSPS
jgi:hypothetical protein